jgi:glycosyltransferase involved in cell wall biosynthesis
MQVALVDPSLFTLPYDCALADGLTQLGHDVVLYGRKLQADDNRPSGVRLDPVFYSMAGSRIVTQLPPRMRLVAKGFDHAWSMLRLPAQLRTVQPDVVHFQWLPLPLVDRHLLRLCSRIAPLVLTMHDTEPFNGDPSARLQTVGYFDCIDRMQHVIVHTEQGRARLQAMGVAPENVSVIPHGVTACAADIADDAMQGILTFVLFGKIKPYKGADVLIEAFARLPDALRAQSRIRIIGKPYMDLASLRELAEARGVASFVSIEPGFVRDEDLPSVFAPGTVAAFPYRAIDASAVLYHAIELGRPILASRIGVFAELLADGAHGRFVAPEDSQGLAAAMAQFVEDRAFASSCARTVRLLSQAGADWVTSATRTAEVYARVNARTRSRPASAMTPVMAPPIP